METTRDERTARNFKKQGAWASTIWSREGLVFPAHQVSSRNQHSSSSIKKCSVIMLVLKRVVFLHSFIWRLISLSLFTWTTNRMVFKNLHLLTLRMSVIILMRVLVQGGYYRSRELTHSPVIRQQVFESGRILSLYRTPALSSLIRLLCSDYINTKL